MAVMEREFARQLDRLSQSEAETATFWQAKHSALNQRFLRADTDARVLRGELDARAAEKDELRRGWDVLRRQLQDRDDEARRLRAQVRGLKDFVSTSTRTDGQATDEEVAGAMARLANGLQNWVISNFRRAKVDLERLGETGEAASDEVGAEARDLSFLADLDPGLAATSKVYVLQSVASSVLVDAVFDAYYVGLSDDQTVQFRDMEKLLLSLGKPLIYPPT